MSAASATRAPSSRAEVRGGAGPAAPGWQVWGALWVVYLVWGSTYLGIAVMVETVPPLLGAAARFGLAGAILLAVMAARRGWSAVRLSRRQILAGLLVGALLPGANAIITVAEREVPSGLAALLVASMPLWVIVVRRSAGERVRRASVAAVAVGFLGAALLLAPGEQSAGAPLPWLLACLAAAGLWATGSFASPKLPLPADPLVSVGWQMLLGGGLCALAGLAVGEASELDIARFSGESVLAFAYLVIFGSLLAYNAYSWLLQHAPLSKVATYAYVNPVVAITLGWLVLDEAITALTLVGAGLIVVSVALVIRSETR